jgi:hypothetical protein
MSYWYILYTYPNYYWNFPLYVYLFKYGSIENDEFKLPDDHLPVFTKLIEETLKYFFVKGVVYNSVNAVKDTVFKVCCQIEKEEDYLVEYTNNMANDLEEFKNRVTKNQFGRYQRGLILLASFLNPNQDKKDYAKFIENTYHIEHILPVKWNNYDGWTQESYENNLNTLGNLIPLEWRLNISAKNEFFDRKKELYKDSLVQDATDLLSIKDWTLAELQVKLDLKKERIFDFFNV